MPYDAMGNQTGGDEPSARSMDEMNLALAQHAKLAAAQMNPMMIPLYMRDAARLGLSMAAPTVGAVAGALSNAQAKGAEYLHGLRGDTASAQEAQQRMVRLDSPEQAARFSSPMQTPVGEEFASAFSALHLPAAGPGSGLPGQGKISPRPFITPNDVRVMGANAARVAKQAREIPQDFSNAQSGLQRLDPVTNKPTMGARLQGAADSLGDTLARRESQGLSPIPGLPESLQPQAKMHAVRPKSQTNFAPDPDYSDPIQRALMPIKKTVSRFENPNLSIEQVELQNKANEPLNNWIDKKLGSYLKNELGTPEDSILKLHEQGITHLPKDTLELGSWLPEETFDRRVKAGFNGEGEAVKRHADAGYLEENEANARMAEHFENLSDSELTSIPASDVTGDVLRNQNPWLKKISSDARLNEFDDGNNLASNLGFDHLIDELRNATNQASGLPANLLIKPEALSRVTVPQAVERVAKINAWREAQKIEVNQALANNAATQLVKEYPTVPGTDRLNEKGLRWVELKAPEGNKPKISKELEDALKYEGDTMGHCVGGYCPDVIEGKSRIYSLRDAKGQPHVTVEVEPGRLSGKNSLDEWKARYTETHGPDTVEPFLAEHPEIAEAFVPLITQIKGKGNKKPNDEYLPFVQDFVKSEQWSDVGDIKNTGLRPTKDVFGPTEIDRFKKYSVDLPKYLTEKDIESFQKLFETLGKPVEHKMLQGVYRGFAGENPNTPELSTTPQKRVADFYAQKRAEQTGQTPHAEMLLIDPFAGKTSGHSIPGTGGQEPLFTNKRTIKPTDVKSRTQLYAKGGGVTAKPTQSVDQMRYALLRNR